MGGSCNSNTDFDSIYEPRNSLSAELLSACQEAFLPMASITHFYPSYYKLEPLWSSGQSSWLEIRRPGFDSRHYQRKKSSESGTGSTQPREYN
jgi:hypothetical protein